MEETDSGQYLPLYGILCYHEEGTEGRSLPLASWSSQSQKTKQTYYMDHSFLQLYHGGEFW